MLSKNKLIAIKNKIDLFLINLQVGGVQLSPKYLGLLPRLTSELKHRGFSIYTIMYHPKIHLVIEAATQRASVGTDDWVAILLSIVLENDMYKKTAATILYHATERRLLPLIRKKGLLPRKIVGVGGGSEQFSELSHPDMVYLTNFESIAVAYGQHYLQDPIVFKLQLSDSSRLYPDENNLSDIFEKYPKLFHSKKFTNYLEPRLLGLLTKGAKSFPKSLMRQVWAIQESLKPLWKESLRNHSTIAYKGIIPADNLLGWYDPNTYTWELLTERSVATHYDLTGAYIIALKALKDIRGGASYVEITDKYKSTSGEFLIRPIIDMFAAPDIHLPIIDQDSQGLATINQMEKNLKKKLKH